MIPMLESLESREAPSSAFTDPIFVAGVGKLETALVGLYSVGTQIIKDQADAGTLKPGDAKIVADFGASLVELPQQMFAWYAQATPEQIAAADAGFIRLAQLGVI